MGTRAPEHLGTRAGLSVGSQRNFSNNFIVDGLSANDDAAGLSGIPFGVDAIEQSVDGLFIPRNDGSATRAAGSSRCARSSERHD